MRNHLPKINELRHITALEFCDNMDLSSRNNTISAIPKR